MKKYTLGIIIISMFIISLPASASTIDEIKTKLIKIQEQLNELDQLKMNSLGAAAAEVRDLTVSNVLSLSPNPTAVGSKNTFTGIASVDQPFTKSTNVIGDLQIKKAGKLYLDTKINITFKKGAKTASFSTYDKLKSEKAGTELEVAFCVDKFQMSANGKIPESNENNNCSPEWFKFQIGQVFPTPDAKKDLTISDVLTVSPNPTVIGSKNTFTGTAIINEAFTKNTNVIGDIQIAKDNNIITDTKIVITFKKGAKTASFSTWDKLNNFRYGDNLQVRFCIDKFQMASNGNIAEFNEDNNCSQNWKTVKLGEVAPTTDASKDLTVSDATVVTSPAVKGSKNTFTATAKINEAFTVDTKVVGDIQFKQNGKVIYDVPVDVTFAKGSKTAQMSTWNTFASEKSGAEFQVGFCVDKYQMSSNGKIAESNEDNNCSVNFVTFKIK